MSRIGRKPVNIPAGVEVSLNDANVITVKGPKGTLTQQFHSNMSIEIADGVINVSETNLMDAVEEITSGKGFDVCVEACGLSQTFLNCIDAAAFAANIILIGNGKKDTTFLHSILLKKELNVFGSRNAYTKDFKALIQQVATGKVDVMKMVSAVYPMEEADEAFKALANNDGSLKKVLVEISK